MSKQDTTPPARTPSKDDLAQLTHFSALLHLLHHRNRNQHRRSPWYRHLSLFRRHLSALLDDYATLTATPATNVERARLKTLIPGVQARVAQRLAFWQEVLVARWMRAFSQVVADGRFSVLGLVMVGVLGGVCKIVGVVEGLETEGQVEVEKVLEEFDREAWGVGGKGDEGEVVARGDDKGEVVARREDEDGDESENDVHVRGRGSGGDGPMATVGSRSDDGADEMNAGATALTEREPSPSPPKSEKVKPTHEKKRRTEETKTKPAKKKRKKGGDAIDDLFSGW